MSVIDLEPYRRRRSVRRAAAYLVIGFGVLGALASLARARDVLEDCIRKAAELLPDDEAAA